MDLKGEIIEIIYQNESNSYTIAVLDDGEQEITIVGYLPFVKLGDTLKVIGKYVEHKDYGLQFKVDTFEKLMPETLGALERYLSNGAIKGIGEVIAKKIIKKFGEDTINVFKFNPGRLAEIKGISNNKAIEMSQSFIENWEVWQIVGFLDRFGIGAENAKKIFDLLGINAIEQIEANPYLLVDLARGVDFKQIDQMALELGIAYNNDKRLESGIKYGLIKATYNGHACVIKQNLVEYVVDLLDVEIEDVENSIITLKALDQIVVEVRDDVEWIYLENFYKVEQQIVYRIMKLKKSKNMKKISQIENEIKKIEKKSNIELSEKQKDAIVSMNDNNVTIITGGPGTGKTTIIKTIIDLYENKNKKVILTAPTGRAAKKMTEATEREALTMHRLLCIGKLDDEGIYSKESDYKGEPIDADVIVVDELSMVDMFLMNYLLGCIYQGTKLILVGDIDQLPSVGPGSVLKDLINSNVLNTVKLDKIFRQAAKSKIILNAHRVNTGDSFISKDEMSDEEGIDEDFFFIKQNSQQKMLDEVISLCTGRLQKFGNYDFFKNIQVLTPTKKGTLGTRELNKALQAVLNPINDFFAEKTVGGVTYRVGDRIMQIKNNYDITWEKEIDLELKNKRKLLKSDVEIGTGVFNGEMGTILEIDQKEKIVEIQFDDGKIAWYEYSDLEQIEHSYAITIHKAQGSEFDVVIMIAPPSAPVLLTRNLLYTGITRAKKLIIIVGSDKVVDYMIQNIDSKRRNTGLEYKLRKEGEKE